MRQYIPDFSLYELEEESTVIFKNAFHAYLNFKLSDLEMMASEQGYEYFSAHTKMYRTKVQLLSRRNGSPSTLR